MLKQQYFWLLQKCFAKSSLSGIYNRFGENK
jgi:hypothetical protein